MKKQNMPNQHQGEPVARDFREEFNSLLDALQLAGHEKEFNEAIGRYKYNQSAFELFQRFADSGEVERLRALSVTNILLDVVPGDGSGHEVYAKSVQDVVDKLGKMGDRIELLESQLTERDALLREIEGCPWVVDEATIPKAGIEAAPQQVVGTMHVGLMRLRKIRATLSASAEPEVEQ